MEIGRQCGTVKVFDAEKGWGFIAPDDGSKDAFVHKKSIEAGWGVFQYLQVGEYVEYRGEWDQERGRMSAQEIRGAYGAPLQCVVNPQPSPAKGGGKGKGFGGGKGGDKGKGKGKGKGFGKGDKGKGKGKSKGFTPYDNSWGQQWGAPANEWGGYGPTMGDPSAEWGAPGMAAPGVADPAATALWGPPPAAM